MLDGRFLEQKMSSEAVGDLPAFEGFGLLGYDNYGKRYQSLWCDTMSTVMMTSEGTPDQSGKMITFVGEAVREAFDPKKFSYYR